MKASSEYICGMWRNNIAGYLMWKPDYEYIRTGKVDLGATSRTLGPPKRREKYYAPSWSWASVVGPIKFEGGPSLFGPDEKVQFKLNKGEAHWPNPKVYNYSLLAVNCVPHRGNPFGLPVSASLTLHGFVASVVFRGETKTLPNRSWKQRGVLAPRISGTGKMLNVIFVPDVPDELQVLPSGSELLLLFMIERAQVKEEAASGPDDPFNEPEEGYGSGIVLKPNTRINEGWSYTRIGTFNYDSNSQVEGWKSIQVARAVTIV